MTFRNSNGCCSLRDTLAGMVFDWVREAKGAWSAHGELTVAGLRGIPVPEEATADWHRMCDELTDRDMVPAMDRDDNGRRRPLPLLVRRQRASTTNPPGSTK